jgi:nucleotide-binding universal stress UspA family protein
MRWWPAICLLLWQEAQVINRIHILVPVSHTGPLEPAFEHALILAKTSGAELHLVHAVPGDRPFSTRAAERLARWAELRARAAAAGVPLETAEQHGDPADVIVLHADARAVDLIVMSTERRTGWEKFRQPSVAERVVRRTTRPVLVVREDGAVPAAFENVLVAVDLTPASTVLVDVARKLFGDDVRQLTVLHAANRLEARDAVLSHARWVVPEYRGHVLDEARKQLEAVTSSIRADANVNVRARVATGSAAEAVVAHAADVDADLIVVGRNRRFMRPGATGIRVLRQTDRPLLVVPSTGWTAAKRPIETEEASLRRAA